MMLQCAAVATHLALLGLPAGVQPAALDNAPDLSWAPPEDAASEGSRLLQLDRAPPASTGFQAALRAGAALPWGDATARGGDALGDRYALQWPVTVDVGFKPIKAIFLGVYGSFGYGVAGDAVGGCERAACSAYTLQLGFQGQYHLGPSERFDPWLGYGAGYELSQQSIEGANYEEAHTVQGATFAKVSVGVDYRAAMGVGPYAEVAAGRFTATRTTVDGREVHAGPIDDAAWHGWVVLGARVVVFP